MERWPRGTEGASFLESGIGICIAITQTKRGICKVFLLRIQRRSSALLDRVKPILPGTDEEEIQKKKKKDLSSLGNAQPGQSGAKLSKGVQRRSRGRIRSETRRKIDFIIDKGVTDRRSNISNGKITSILSSARRGERRGEGRDIGSDEDTREAGMQMTERRARIVRRMQANVLPWLRHWDRALSSRPTIASVLDGGFVRTTHITNLTRRVAPTLLFFSSPVKGALANLEDARPFYP